MEELAPSEIANIIKYEESNPPIFHDGGFAGLYAELRESLDRLSESKRLSFAPLTYRELAEACTYMDKLENDKSIEANMMQSMPSDFYDAWKYRLNYYLEIVGKKYPLAAKFIAIW